MLDKGSWGAVSISVYPKHVQEVKTMCRQLKHGGGKPCLHQVCTAALSCWNVIGSLRFRAGNCNAIVCFQQFGKEPHMGVMVRLSRKLWQYSGNVKVGSCSSPHFDLVWKSEKSTSTICSKHVGYFSENKDVENKEMNSCSSSGVVAMAHMPIYIFGIHSTSGVLKISPELVRLVLVIECAVYHVISVGSE